MSPQTANIYSVGHSTLPFEDFLAILESFHIRQLVDVRAYPGSRRYPHFNEAFLAEQLPQHNVSYKSMKNLGGRRSPKADSPHTAWRNAAFRGFADYMQSVSFAQALDELISHSSEGPTAIMCAEAVPWRCHRFLISDALTVKGVEVRHIMDAGVSRLHTLNPMIDLVHGELVYCRTESGR